MRWSGEKDARSDNLARCGSIGARDKILRIAGAIVELASAEQIPADIVAEAIQYRRVDRQL